MPSPVLLPGQAARTWGGRLATSTRPPKWPAMVYTTERYHTARSKRPCRTPRFAPRAVHPRNSVLRITAPAQPPMKLSAVATRPSAASHSSPCPHLLRPSAISELAAKVAGRATSSLAWSPGTPGDPHCTTSTLTGNSAEEATTSMMVPDLCVPTPTGFRSTAPNPEGRRSRSRISRSSKDSARRLAMPRHAKCRLKSPRITSLQSRNLGRPCSSTHSCQRRCQKSFRTATPE